MDDIFWMISRKKTTPKKIMMFLRQRRSNLDSKNHYYYYYWWNGHGVVMIFITIIIIIIMATGNVSPSAITNTITTDERRDDIIHNENDEKNFTISNTVTTNTRNFTTTTSTTAAVSAKEDEYHQSHSIHQCSFQKAANTIPIHEHCNFNLDLDGSDPNSMTNASNCRVLAGHLSLRRMMFTKNNNLVIFPKLELIRDFLLIHDFRSDLGVNVTLGHIFPRLRRIFGYSRIDNITLYIYRFYSSDVVDLPLIEEVCGPVKVNSSRPFFRHSPTYWRLVQKYHDTRIFTQELSPFPREHLTVLNSDQDSVHVKLHFHNWINEEAKKIKEELKVSFFMIDRTFYDYVESLPERRPLQFCNRSKRVILADLSYSDKHTWHDDPDIFDTDGKKFYSRIVNIYDTQYGPNHFSYHQRVDNFDLCGIRADRVFIHSQGLFIEETFLYDHVYVFKFEFCNSTEDTCDTIVDRFLFIPLRQELEISEPSYWWIYMLVALLLLAAILGIVLLCKKSHYRLNSFVNIDVVSVNPDYGLMNPDQSLWSWPVNYNTTLLSMAVDNVTCEINRDNLVIYTQKLLGRGEFGYVYEGLLFEHDPNCPGAGSCSCASGESVYESLNQTGCTNHQAPHLSNSIRVAIKQLKENVYGINKEKFIGEANYMKTFNSNFLVRLIGINTVKEPILVVMEFMENGDLKRYLRSRYNDFLKSRNNALLPTVEDIIRMAIQIADGMHYLHCKKVIHRDLAARNCMVAADLTVKIGDFGLTRDLYEKDYYRLSEEMPMPLRWMSPESVRKMIFTQQSDIWSYGVVLWEIMTFGEQPYRGKTDIEVKKLIADCERLSRPFYFSQALWDIAKMCWRKKPKQRPSFGEIIEILYPQLNNRHEFDNLSYYVSSRASYVTFSTFGLFTNYCYQLVSKSCPGSNIGNDIESNRRRNTADSSTTGDSVQGTPLSHFMCPFRMCARNRADNSRLININRRSSSPTTVSNTVPHTRDQSVRSTLMRSISQTSANQKVIYHHHPHHQPCMHPLHHDLNRGRNHPHHHYHSSIDSLHAESDAQSEITAITSLSTNYGGHGGNQPQIRAEQMPLI